MRFYKSLNTCIFLILLFSFFLSLHASRQNPLELEEEKQPDNQPSHQLQSEFLEPIAHQMEQFGVTEISRNKQKGLYFPRSSSLEFSGVKISHSEHDIFKENFPLQMMDFFLKEQVRLKDAKWSRNHLSASVFLFVEQEEHPSIIEGMIRAKEIELPDNKLYNFYSYPDQFENKENELIVDFMSSSVKNPLYEIINQKYYLPISKSCYNPIIAKPSTHGDQLALDVILSNYDLFFNLINRTAHREDLPILGMGARYYSSYDACNDCFSEIYEKRKDLEHNLYTVASLQGYNLSKITSSTEKIPVFSLFYSNRPYLNDVQYFITNSNEYSVAANWEKTCKNGQITSSTGTNFHPLYEFKEASKKQFICSKPFNQESIFLYVDQFESFPSF